MPSLRFLAAMVSTALATSTLYATPPTDADSRKEWVGQPLSLQVAPNSIVLNGPRDVRQLVVTGMYDINGVALPPQALAYRLGQVDLVVNH